MSGGPSALAGQRLTAAFYDENVAAPWTALTLQNSWSNVGGGLVAAQYRLRDTVTCEVIGHIRSGTVTSGTTIFTLPAGYYNPNNTQGLMVMQQISTAPAMVYFQALTNGIVQIVGGGAASTNYFLHGFIALDA